MKYPSADKPEQGKVIAIVFENGGISIGTMMDDR